MIEFAINFSPALTAMIQRGERPLDRIKCPPWPRVIVSARATGLPVYIHFPLSVATPGGLVVDTQQGVPADWARVADLLAETETPFVNLHIDPRKGDFPGIAPRSTRKADIATVTEAMIAAIAPVVARFGAARVIIENNKASPGSHLWAAATPEALNAIVEATGCGFLLDLSHARLAARHMRIDANSYIKALPLYQTRELHVTGLQALNRLTKQRARALGLANSRSGSKLRDHMAFTRDDWAAFDWLLKRVRAGAMPALRLIALEYGGLGGWLEAMLDPQALRRDAPALYDRVRHLNDTRTIA